MKQNKLRTGAQAGASRGWKVGGLVATTPDMYEGTWTKHGIIFFFVGKKLSRISVVGSRFQVECSTF